MTQFIDVFVKGEGFFFFCFCNIVCGNHAEDKHRSAERIVFTITGFQCSLDNTRYVRADYFKQSTAERKSRLDCESS